MKDEQFERMSLRQRKRSLLVVQDITARLACLIRRVNRPQCAAFRHGHIVTDLPLRPQMTVDPALWDAFHKAKDALFSAIRVSAPHIPNVLLEAPANRAASRAAIASAIVALEQIRETVESTEKEFSQLGVHLQATIARARYCLPPVGALPIEMLQEVFLHAAAPRDHEMVRALASVNQAWREAALGQRELFACPRWSKWPIELLELWCSRARGSPLDVLLEDADIITIHDNKDQRRLQLLQSTKPTWECLYFQSRWCQDIHKDREFIRAARWLFKDTLPALQTLHFCLLDPSLSNAFTYVPITTPNLQSLHYGGVQLHPQEPLNSLSELCVLKGAQRSLWMDMLRHTPALESLAVVAAERFDHLEHIRRFECPSITCLAFIGHYAQPHLERALRCMSCPNAMGVCVADEPPTESLFQAIVSLC